MEEGRSGELGKKGEREIKVGKREEGPKEGERKEVAGVAKGRRSGEKERMGGGG